MCDCLLLHRGGTFSVQGANWVCGGVWVGASERVRVGRDFRDHLDQPPQISDSDIGPQRKWVVYPRLRSLSIGKTETWNSVYPGLLLFLPYHMRQPSRHRCALVYLPCLSLPLSLFSAMSLPYIPGKQLGPDYMPARVPGLSSEYCLGW